jgi:hypothetical protein
MLESPTDSQEPEYDPRCIIKDPSFKELQHDINKIGYDLKYMAQTSDPNPFVINHKQSGLKQENKMLQSLTYMQQKAGMDPELSA